ncbi:MAG: FAD-dependent monooxygenase [Chitinophagaceae bacterium]|nr:FAD-dependent monooxygenase [Chitinophagaceae bacterium]MBP7107017.1 FAD-dependent monooxygenase [Chitinophagaceae bacterium]MBP7314679.1 FAD-dependent monooxygenase [Chitinophagaceae bacterium]
MKKEITIIGAGLVGSLLSIYLAKRGHKVAIYERRSDMRTEDMSAGRSINLALSDRGLLALGKVGLTDEIKKICIPMHGRQIHNVDGSITFQPYGKEGQYINSVSRGELNKQLMTIAEEHGVNIHFNEKCKTLDWNNDKIEFENTAGKQLPSSKADIIFGADGAFSAARLQHQLQHDKFDYHQYYIDCGYKELSIPPNEEGEFALEPNALHIWPRKDYMLIALPNLDKTFTCTLFFPFEGELSFDKINTEEKVKQFFATNFADVVPLMPDYVNEFFTNPTSSLVTIKCFPWVRDDKFALIGDAAHALVPFFGQGMNCGFEDCRILDELIEKNGDDWHKILSEYQTLRKPDADAIADMAANNFTEMRDRTADPKFLLQKKIEARLHENYPDKWIPAYSQVTFSPHIRYSDALARGNRQETIMQEVMTMTDIETKWESEEVEKMILGKLIG